MDILGALQKLLGHRQTQGTPRASSSGAPLAVGRKPQPQLRGVGGTPQFDGVNPQATLDAMTAFRPDRMNAAMPFDDQRMLNDMRIQDQGRISIPAPYEPGNLGVNRLQQTADADRYFLGNRKGW